MEANTWKKLAWRYRFNDEVVVEDGGATYNDVAYSTLPEAVRQLAAQVMSKACRIHKIDKGNGTFRYVYAPNQLYKEFLQSKLPNLEYMLDVADPQGMFHAFRRNYNPVTNGKAHIGYNYSAKFDLKSFFDQVTREMVPHLPKDVLEFGFIEGVSRQGLPTSPLIASLALQPVAYKLETAIEQQIGQDFVMTVYADDITISFNDRMVYEDIKELVYKHIQDAGLLINFGKTRLKFGHKNGMRRIICGIAVGRNDITRTRSVKRLTREALYHGDSQRVAGLMEWASCKEPRSRR